MADDNRHPARVFIGVGSNIDPRRNIVRAFDLVAARLRMASVSVCYRSPAVGGTRQPDFLNGVWEAYTGMPARELKYGLLRVVEDSLERRRTADKNAARTIDLDLLLYGEMIADDPGLTIPDPGLRVYPFVALPLLELDPDIHLPGNGERLADLFPGTPLDYGLIEQPDISADVVKRLRKGNTAQ